LRRLAPDKLGSSGNFELPEFWGINIVASKLLVDPLTTTVFRAFLSVRLLNISQDPRTRGRGDLLKPVWWSNVNPLVNFGQGAFPREPLDLLKDLGPQGVLQDTNLFLYFLLERP